MKRDSSYIIRKMVVFIFALIAVYQANGQRFSYDEIIESMGSLTHEQAYSRLFEYRGQNPQMAGTYLQLGYVSEQIIKELDPFREIEMVNYNIDNAVIYYDLFIHFLTNNEVRRNKKHYANIPLESAGFELTNDGAIAFAQSRVTFCKNLKEALKESFNALKSSKDHYNNCVQIFNAINNEYESFNDALLKTDEKLLAKLSELDAEFKATQEAFDEYKELLQKFPIGQYNQQYKVIPIRTFRLDGITNSDFLQNMFQLWDYGKWVADYKAVYGNEILNLREEIAGIQWLFDTNLRTLSKSSFSDELALKSFDEMFLFKLGRFDSNSLIRELFRYSDKRQQFMLSTKNTLNNPNDSSSALLNRKLRYYYRVAQDLNVAKSELKTLRNAIHPDKISRFSNFFTTSFYNDPDLSNYLKNQTLLLEETFDKTVNNLDTYLENEASAKGTFTLATGNKGIKISLQPNCPDSNPALNSYITEDVYYSQGQPVYVSGYQVKSKANVAFVAKIDNGRKVDWIKVVETDNAALNKMNQSATKVLGFENGLVAIISACTQDDEAGKVFKHSLVQFGTTGKIVRRSQVSSPHKPILLMFDEINQIGHLAFGEKQLDEDDFYSKISICQVDSLSATNWTAELNVKGNLAGLVRADNQCVAYLNFVEYDINGQQGVASTSKSDWAMLMVNIASEGEITRVKPVITSESFYIDKVYSLSSNEVNLLGYSGNPYKEKGPLRYFVYSTTGETIFSNIDVL